MNIPIIGRFIDERFLEHRRRSTSVAGIAGAFVAIGLFLFHYYANGTMKWELFAVAATMAAVKVLLMIWYRFTD